MRISAAHKKIGPECVNAEIGTAECSVKPEDVRFRGKADMGRRFVPIIYDAIDPKRSKLGRNPVTQQSPAAASVLSSVRLTARAG
jgi:hypothetical protein